MSETIAQRIDAIVEDFTHAAASDARLGSCAACSHPSCERKRQQEREARIAGRELAEYIATARAEVERLTRDRDGWERRTKEIGSVVIRAWALLRDWWQYAQLEERAEGFADALARAIAADSEHDKYSLAEIRRWKDESEKRSADLAAVRKVEEWIQRGNDPLKPEHAIAGVVNRRYGAFVRCEAEETTVATGKSLIALGRALAAQEGTDAT